MAELVTPDGVRLHVEDQGSGPELVLVHGWCGSSRIWDPVVAKLPGRRAVRFDLRGCGASQSKEGTFDLDHYAQDLRTVIKEKGLENPTLVGWSLGVGIVHRYFQLFGVGGVAGACLIDYPMRLEERRDVADKVCHKLAKEREAFLSGFVDRMLLAPSPAIHKLIVTEMKRVPRETACRMYRSMGQAPKPKEETFEIPALLVFPEKGWFPEALPDWRVRFQEHDAPPFPKSRHLAPLEEADRFSEALLEFSA